jgi:lipopolysaccharide transport protein LptA
MRGAWVLLLMGVSSLSASEVAVERSTEAPKTVITSQSARVLGKGQSTEFLGDVKLTRGNDFMSADRLVTEDNNAIARAWGHVFFRRDGTEEPVRWEAWGDRAVYETAAASGTLWGETRMARARRTPNGDEAMAGGVVEMVAPEITLARVSRSTGTSDLSAGIVTGRGGGVFEKRRGGDRSPCHGIVVRSFVFRWARRSFSSRGGLRPPGGLRFLGGFRPRSRRRGPGGASGFNGPALRAAGAGTGKTGA